MDGERTFYLPEGLTPEEERAILTALKRYFLQESPKPAPWVLQGRIDATYLTHLVVPGETLCFVCGPPALVGEIPQLLKDAGVEKDQILMEQWG